MIIFIAGLVGVGKSSIAKSLADKLSIHYYDIDEVKKVVYPQDPDFERNIRQGIPFKRETRLKVFEKAAEDFRRLAETHEHLVVDETLHLKELRQVLLDAAEAYFGGYVIVWVKADEAVIHQRLEKKERSDHILTDPSKMYRSFAKEFESFEGSYIVCENNGTVQGATETLMSLIRSLASLKW